MNSLMWKIGGTRVFCLDMIKALARVPKFEVYIICEKMPNSLMNQIENINVNIIETGFSGIGLGSTLNAAINWVLLPVKFVRKVVRIIGKINPDIINPHNFPDVFYATYYKAHEKSDLKISWFCHEPYRPFYDRDCINLKPLRDQLFFRTYRSFFAPIDIKYVRSFVDVIGANSNYTAELIRKVYARNSRVVYPGVDVNRFRPTTSDLKYRLKCDSLILSVGEVDMWDKNLRIIPAVLSRIRKTYDTRWVHIGSGLDEKRLLDLAKTLNVQDYLQIMNYLADDDLIKYYSAANLVVYPSVREPFGLVPLESMACETPVIASKYGGTSETIVHGKTGLLVDMTSISEIAEAVSDLLGNKTLSRKMGILDRERIIKSFTLEKTVRDFVSLICS